MKTLTLLREVQAWMIERNITGFKCYTVGRADRKKWTAQFHNDGKTLAAGMGIDMESAIEDAIKDAD